MVKIYKKDIENTKIKDGLLRQKKEGINTLEHFLDDKPKPAKVIVICIIFRIIQQNMTEMQCLILMNPIWKLLLNYRIMYQEVRLPQ